MPTTANYRLDPENRIYGRGLQQREIFGHKLPEYRFVLYVWATGQDILAGRTTAINGRTVTWKALCDWTTEEDAIATGVEYDRDNGLA